MFRRLALLLAAASLFAGCATERPLPAWQDPIPKTEYQHVRTTAYFDGEADHRAYTNHNALGTCLQHGRVNSAAADWGRWPAGTVFQLMQTGELYVVDDYGWALAGTNTIDLYKPSRLSMNQWGVRQVDIHILRWGDPHTSYQTLCPRGSYRHVTRMLHEIRPQLADSPYPALSNPVVSAAPVRTASTTYTTTTTRTTTTTARYVPASQLRPFNSTW